MINLKEELNSIKYINDIIYRDRKEVFCEW